MAIYHFTAKSISFGKGESAVHRAAYHARIQLYDERNGKATRDYAHKGDHAWSGIFAPNDAPAWTQDRDRLWNNAEAAERQANGQPARNIEFALPNELTREQQIRLITDFCREQFARKGMVADANLHSDYDASGHQRPDVKADEPRNDHVHVLLTMRRLDGDRFARTKTDAREWNSKAQLAAWRESWARMGARALQRAGFETEARRFVEGHKTLPEQRKAAIERGDNVWADQLNREADMKQGAAVSDMEARGQSTDRGEERRKRKARNAERDELKHEAQIINLELARLARQDAPSGPARVAREKGRFEEWANTRRAELQNLRLEEEGDLGRRHTYGRDALERQLEEQYGPARQAKTALLAAITARQAIQGARGSVYRVSGRAASDSAEAARLSADIADMNRRAAEQMGGLARDQERERAALAAVHAGKATALEQRIARALDRRESEGWVRAGGEDRTRSRQPRREATTGQEIADPAGIDAEAENLAVDASSDFGVDVPGQEPEAAYAPELGQGDDLTRPWTPEERAAKVEAAREAREAREAKEREQDRDTGHTLDR